MKKGEEWSYKFENPEIWEYIKIIFESGFDGVPVFSRSAAAFAEIPFHTYRRIGEHSNWILKKNFDIILDSMGIRCEDLGDSVKLLSEDEKNADAAKTREQEIKRKYGDDFYSAKTKNQWKRVLDAGENKLIPFRKLEKIQKKRRSDAGKKKFVLDEAAIREKRRSITMAYEDNVSDPDLEIEEDTLSWAVTHTLPELGLKYGLIESSYKYLKGKKSKIELICTPKEAKILKGLDGQEKTYSEILQDNGLEGRELTRILYDLQFKGLLGARRQSEIKYFARKEDFVRKLKAVYDDELEKIRDLREDIEAEGVYFVCEKEHKYVSRPSEVGNRIVCPDCYSPLLRKTYYSIRGDLKLAETILEKAKANI